MKKYVDRYIEGAADCLADLRKSGIAPNKLLHIPYGVDGSLFSDHSGEMRKQFRQEFNIPESSFVMGRIARFHYDKGIDQLLTLVPELLQQIPQLKIVLVGNGPEMSNLKQLTKTLSIEETVIFTDFYLETQKALAAFDLVAITARKEALSISVLEALAASKPFVSYDIGGLSEAIIKDVNGLMITENDKPAFKQAIVDLYEDSNLLESLGDASLGIFNGRYDLSNMCNKYEQEYTRLLK